MTEKEDKATWATIHIGDTDEAAEKVIRKSSLIVLIMFFLLF